MANIMSLRDPLIAGKKLRLPYEVEGEWTRYFSKPLEIEYDMDLENVPASILNIPFLANILPIAWIFDARVEVNAIDLDFLNSLEPVKKGYQEMYPDINFNGTLVYDKIHSNKYTPADNNSLLFFSGGLDSMYALLNHKDENLALMMIWGQDLALANNDAWHAARQNMIDTANKFNKTCLAIKTNFREFIREDLLNKHITSFGSYIWWYHFQHGIGIASLAAPYSYLKRSKFTYLGSTHSVNSKPVKCASSLKLEGNLHFGGCRVIHDEHDKTRQDKIKHVCRHFADSGHILRVCYASETGKNCSHCEKCYRTIFGIIAEGYNPANFGFEANSQCFINARKLLRKQLNIIEGVINAWIEIQNKFIENKRMLNLDPAILWIFKMNIAKINRTPYKIFRRFKKRYISGPYKKFRRSLKHKNRQCVN